MNIAILIYGQPRFFDKTAQLIKEEFDIPGWNTDFFIHNWDQVGHTPECDARDRFHPGPDINTIRTILHPRSYTVDTYDVITEYTKSFLDSLQLIKRKIPYSTIYNKERYYFGQHISIQKCYQQILKYEERVNQKYDVIIKVRTDIVYKTKQYYKNTEEYINAKKQKYTIKETDIPTCNVNALRINTFNTETEKWVGENITHFYKNNYTTLETREENIYTWDYWKRLCFNDWLLICNRKAAEIYFNKWFENLYITIGKDLSNNKTKNKWLARSEHTMQGQLGINYNVKLASIGKRRDRKIICARNVKPDIETTGKILLKKEDSIEVLKQEMEKLYT